MTEPVPVLEMRDVSKTYPVLSRVLRRPTGHLQAVSNVSLQLWAGETIGIVGESGSGKSTLGRLAVRLISPTSGSVLHDGHDVSGRLRREERRVRRPVQLVFQDPYSSFDPLAPLASSVGEPLDAQRPKIPTEERRSRLRELVELVRLRPDHLDRYPKELSGGQLQRLGIARALACNPGVVVLDEPVSSLDVATQAQVINLLAELQDTLGTAYMFISHSPALVRHASDRIAVMYLGEVVETGRANDVYEDPKHPYTQALLSAVLVPDPVIQRARRRIILTGEIPNAALPPPGCRFHPRCPHVMEVCRVTAPPPVITADGTVVRCHLHSAHTPFIPVQSELNPDSV